ncbi:MAG: hypothetical protein ABR860_12070 [Terracidiphilus sp.]
MKSVGACLLIAAGILASTIHLSGQEKPSMPNGGSPACRPVHRESADRRWVLTPDTTTCLCFGEESEAYKAPCGQGVVLVLSDQQKQQTRQIKFDGYAANAAWSPDSSAFFVNVSVVSNESDAFLVQAGSLEKVDLRMVIPEYDSSLMRYLGDHDYFIVRKWVGEKTALVQVCGHVSERRSVQFDFRYRVSFDGRISRVSRKTGPRDLECAYP